MLWTQTLIPTARQVPAEAEVPSHQLMLRAGLIRKLGAGVYDYLPLGLRSLQKAMQIVREEMAAAGAIEVMLPSLVPLELYQTTGRDQAYGDNLFRVKDRHGRVQALGPTHEEIVTELFAGYVESYRQLPLTLYQIQTKFRDEFRPRFGVLRSREFQMKDAYSFHAALDGPGGLNEIYQKQYDAYCRIFARCGLPYLSVEAESGPIGGSASHEFMVPSPTGEDTILISDQGNYAANVEKCETGPRSHDLTGPATGELQTVQTPNCSSIEDVGDFMKVKPKNFLKTLVYQPVNQESAGAIRFVLAIVRGDHEGNEGKIKAAAGFAVQMADAQQARDAGLAIGFVAPHAAVGRSDVMLLVDPDAAQAQFWAAGANQMDHHVKHFNWQREVVSQGVMPKVVDIRNAVAGDPSPKNDGGILQTQKGIEIGHVFKLGDKYTKAMNVTILGADQQRFNPIMGCYGIGVNRILAAAIERAAGNDADGIVWPRSIAPYQVVITTIKYDGAVKQTADQLAKELESLGIDTLIDDRDERPGVKFKDADLIGFPLRVTVGDKALANGQVEIKARNGSNGAKGELVAIDQAMAKIQAMLTTL